MTCRSNSLSGASSSSLVPGPGGRSYGPAHGLDPPNWTFLTSGPDRPEDTTRRLAERFGHKFAQTEDGYQIHGVVTHVIDREGRWQANFHGLEFEPTNMVLYINALTHGHGELVGQDSQPVLMLAETHHPARAIAVAGKKS